MTRAITPSRVMRNDSVAQIFRTMQPWQKGHEARYEQMERARLWRLH